MPQSFLIYYGYPSLVNGCETLACAEAQFKPFEYLVFGDNLELSNHPDHDHAQKIIQTLHTKNPEMKIFWLFRFNQIISRNHAATRKTYSRLESNGGHPYNIGVILI